MPTKKKTRTHPSWKGEPTPRAIDAAKQVWHISHLREKILSDLSAQRDTAWKPNFLFINLNPSRNPLFDHLTCGKESFVSTVRMLWSTTNYVHYAKVKDAAKNRTTSRDASTGSFDIEDRLEIYRSSIKVLHLTGAFPLLHDVNGVEDLFDTFPCLSQIEWNHGVTCERHLHCSSISKCSHTHIGGTDHFVLGRTYAASVDSDGHLPNLDMDSNYLPASWDITPVRQLHIGKISRGRRSRFDFQLRDDEDHDELPDLLKRAIHSLFVHPSHSIETWIWILHKRQLLDIVTLTELNLGGSWITVAQLHRIAEATGPTLHALTVQVKDPKPSAVLGFAWTVFPFLVGLEITIDCPSNSDTGLLLNPLYAHEYDSDSGESFATDSTFDIDPNLPADQGTLECCQVIYIVNVPRRLTSALSMQWVDTCVPTVEETAAFFLQFPADISHHVAIMAPKGCLATRLGGAGHGISLAYSLSTAMVLEKMRGRLGDIMRTILGLNGAGGHASDNEDDGWDTDPEGGSVDDEVAEVDLPWEPETGSVD